PTRHFGRAQGPPLRLHLVRQRVVNGFEDEAPLVLARFRLAETSGPEPRALPREHVVERPSGQRRIARDALDERVTLAHVFAHELMPGVALGWPTGLIADGKPLALRPHRHV